MFCRRTSLLLFALIAFSPLLQLASAEAEEAFQVGLASVEITPPTGFPMAGYYHERLAEGTIDPLLAKAIFFHSESTSAILVVCDLIGIATDLSSHVKQRVQQETGVPASNIVIAATHTHTAPDYMKELWLRLGEDAQQQPARAEYIDHLLQQLVNVCVLAKQDLEPTEVHVGATEPAEVVSFNRRFVMRDGSVKTWQNYNNPDVVRAAAGIDPEIGIVELRRPSGKVVGVLSNFALHLDTVGGQRWSADYPAYIANVLREKLVDQPLSIFATGCCGDINHANPRSPERNSAQKIGTVLGEAIGNQIGKNQQVVAPRLVVKNTQVKLPLLNPSEPEIRRSMELLTTVKQQTKIDFFDHVRAHKYVMIDQFRNSPPVSDASELITWGLSRSLTGIGGELPVDVTVFGIGDQLGIVCLPGEVFVDLGLAIKQASPFQTTLVIELCNTVETVYIPTRAAYAGGSYEVTNSAVAAGSGEMLVEASLRLLREAASELQNSAQ